MIDESIEKLFKRTIYSKTGQHSKDQFSHLHEHKKTYTKPTTPVSIPPPILN